MNEQESMKVTAFGREVTLTRSMMEVLSDWQEMNWSTARQYIHLVDTIHSSLSMGHVYEPSEAGLARAIAACAGFKDYLYKLINDQDYERFQ